MEENTEPEEPLNVVHIHWQGKAIQVDAQQGQTLTKGDTFTFSSWHLGRGTKYNTIKGTIKNIEYYWELAYDDSTGTIPNPPRHKPRKWVTAIILDDDTVQIDKGRAGAVREWKDPEETEVARPLGRSDLKKKTD